jgi:hypothetical protein
MIIISHRGNLNGPDCPTENTPAQIDKCIKHKIPVEINVWVENNTIFLGHDDPFVKVDLGFILDRYHMLFVHCKNKEAFEYFLDFPSINCFWHQNDDYTMTSKKQIWTFPRKPTVAKSIIVCQTELETQEYLQKPIMGICTDFVEFALNLQQNKLEV